MTHLKSLCICVFVLFIPFNSNAQTISKSTTPLADYTSSYKFHDNISLVTVLGNIGLDTYHSFDSDNKKEAFIKQGIALGATELATIIVKHFVHEDRPDHSSNDSFWSGHTATAGASSGYYYPAGITLTVVTGIERVNANRHHPKDVVIGGIVGTGIRILTDKYVHIH